MSNQNGARHVRAKTVMSSPSALKLPMPRGAGVVASDQPSGSPRSSETIDESRADLQGSEPVLLYPRQGRPHIASAAAG